MKLDRIAATLLLVVPLLVGASNEPAPTAVATTVIHADGTSAVTVRLPNAARLGFTDVDIDLQEQPAAYVVFAPRTCRNADQDWCPEPVLLRPADSPITHLGFHTSNDPNLVGGLVDVYIVADGPVTITANFGHLADATVELTTDRPATGSLMELPRHCIDQLSDGCREIAAGGGTDTVGARGVAMAWGWAANPSYDIADQEVPNFAQTKSVVVCLRPEDRGASVDPDDYRWGCPLTPDEDNTSTWQSSQRNYVLNSGPLGIYGAATMADLSQGQVYAGFAGHAVGANRALGDPGNVGAWAGWLQVE